MRKYKCMYCEKKFLIPLTRDHIVPRCMGSAVSITIAVCRICNQFKGGDSPMMFVGRMETILKNFKQYIGQTRESLII